MNDDINIVIKYRLNEERILESNLTNILATASSSTNDTNSESSNALRKDFQNEVKTKFELFSQENKFHRRGTPVSPTWINCTWRFAQKDPQLSLYILHKKKSKRLE